MLQSFKLALKSIWGNKMRSFLTMLGIIIGVAAVIILVSLVNGYMGSVVESFASMGVNQINVNVTNLASRSLDVDQMYAFYEEHTDLFGELSPNVALSSTIKYGDDSMTSTSVAGAVNSIWKSSLMNWKREGTSRIRILSHARRCAS